MINLTEMTEREVITQLWNQSRGIRKGPDGESVSYWAPDLLEKAVLQGVDIDSDLVRQAFPTPQSGLIAEFLKKETRGLFIVFHIFIIKSSNSSPCLSRLSC